jgi:hypothetical protein
VRTPLRIWLLLVVLNAALAAMVQAAAPDQPRLSDRNDYEYNGRQPLTAFCPNSIYCYRILVPMLLERIPIDPELRWRGLQLLAHTATGTLVAVASTPAGSPWIASILLQTSYAFTFTAYDPFTPDPVIFLVAALVLYCWLIDRSFAVALMAIVFVFAKETTALIVSAPALAAIVFARVRPAWWRWLVPAALAWLTLLGFHWYMDTYAGWGISKNAAANFSTGSWLAIWWKNNPSIAHKALMVFSPFGFAWIFAALGYRHASPAIRQLTIGAMLPMLALVYVQTPERALGNAFFVIVPLAAAFLAQVPPAAAIAAAVTNGLVTARIGLSTEVLPSSSVLLIPATLAAIWAIAAYQRQHGIRFQSSI